MFFLRGLALNLGADWVRSAPIRYLSYTVDTVLLTAALMLMAIVQQYPFVHGWLTMKVVLLVVYMVLGIIALWQGRRRAVRFGCWVAALAVYGFIVSVALAHDPWGIFRSLAGS